MLCGFGGRPALTPHVTPRPLLPTLSRGVFFCSVPRGGYRTEHQPLAAQQNIGKAARGRPAEQHQTKQVLAWRLGLTPAIICPCQDGRGGRQIAPRPPPPRSRSPKTAAAHGRRHHVLFCSVKQKQREAYHWGPACCVDVSLSPLSTLTTSSPSPLSKPHAQGNPRPAPPAACKEATGICKSSATTKR